MGGRWVYNPVPRPILPHPNTWTLDGILELHSSPLVCEISTSIAPEEVEYWDNYLASEREIANVEHEEEESVADLTNNSWPCIS
eukprot:5279528-Heterocapsa_arctica.AAC.1